MHAKTLTSHKTCPSNPQITESLLHATPLLLATS